ncbi:MAG: formate dehydrogenase accessory sulfurtransferase FdhD [Archaeoglobus sp.]|jgi:FdhD protein|nr:formate dehydrogenase accessory sulfurtransferase FdhD [Archaeoglobus sp.]
MIKIIGEPLEIAKEREITFIINGTPNELACTPNMLRELALGFIISEGIADSIEKVDVKILENAVIVNVNQTNQNKIDCKKIENAVKFKLEDLQRSLSLLEIEEYRRTRGYHVAVIVGREKFFRAYDVGRHNAVDKAIGSALLNGENLGNSYLLLSGRISLGIAKKCFNSGIPLVVSKAAIFDSAIEFCKKTGLSAVSFATNIAIGDAIE